jgi:TfoX/Sxy family transcriptional regulator of competence genes
MKWVKAPEGLKILIDQIMEAVECEKRPMFGYPAFFINKNMSAGLFQDKLFLRLSPAQVTSLKKIYPTLSNLEPVPGRPMKDYYVVPEKLYTDPKKMASVVEETTAYCRSLPEKVKKPPKKIVRTPVKKPVKKPKKNKA